MGIYGYEQPIQYTPEKIFNPTTANMVLTSMKNYADAVEREYVRALEEEKEFFKDYGNFYSSVPGAMEAYYNAGPGKVMNEINAAREGGIDLLRSLEGRNKIRGMIRGANIGIMKQLEAQNNMYGTYMKGLLDAVFKGMLTPEQAQWKMQHDNVAGFTALDKDGNVRQFGASPLIGPFEDTNAFLKRVAGDIEDTYMGMEGAYDVNGVGYKKLKDAIGMSLPEYLRTDGGRFAYETFVKLVSGLDMSKLPQDQQELLMNDKEMYNKFGNAIFQQGLAKYGHKDVKLNPIFKMDRDLKDQKELEAYRYELKDKYDELESERDERRQINVYKATHPNEFDKDGNPAPSAPTVDSLSYVRDVYDAAVGKVFGVDGYTASHMIEGEEGYTNAGQNIFKREESILRNYQCDVDKCISAHTNVGNLLSNIKMLDVPMGGSAKISGTTTKTPLNQNQFLRQNTTKKIYDASLIIFNTAGYYKKDKSRTKEQDDNYKDLAEATYFTVTNEVVGHLHKGGRFILYVKVIGDNGSVGYIPMNVYSNKKEGGHSYSAKNKSHDQDLGYDTLIEGSIKQRDLLATNVYTKEGSATNNGALEREMQN